MRLGLGVAVCIIGQTSRLELESKIEHMLKPLARAGDSVSVFSAQARERARVAAAFKRLSIITVRQRPWLRARAPAERCDISLPSWSYSSTVTSSAR